MIIKHTVTLEVEAEVEISHVSVSNDGIGYYEYGSEKCFDPGNDYVEDYSVDNIFIDTGSGKTALSGEIFKMAEEIIRESCHFEGKIMERVNEDVQASKYERAEMMREDR